MYGSIVSALPEDFTPKEEWLEYDVASNSLPHVHPQAVGLNPRGVRWGLPPIFFEEYISDTEPQPRALQGPPRTVVWRRITRTDVPRGWWQFSRKPSRMEGFCRLMPGYERHWSKSAHYDRMRWLRDSNGKTHILEPVRFEEFRMAYSLGTVSRALGDRILILMERYLQGECREHMEMYGVRDLATGELVAGAGFITAPSANASYYMAGFVRPELSKVPAMIALIDSWHERSLARGIKYLHFGEFWIPGKPESWRGYSDFKAKFGLNYILYQPPVWKFVIGKFS